MAYQYLQSYHGGYLFYHKQKQQLVISDIHAKSLLPIHFVDSELFVINDSLKMYLECENEKVNLVYSKDNHTISAKFNGKTNNTVNIFSANYLQCYPNRDLRFNAVEAREWECFYLKGYSDWLF